MELKKLACCLCLPAKALHEMHDKINEIITHMGTLSPDGIMLQGYLTSASDLPAQAENGHAYMVGTHLHVYDNGWHDLGTVKGDKGDPGKDGVTPTIDATLTKAATAADAKATGDMFATKANLTGATFTGGVSITSPDYTQFRINRTIDGVGHSSVQAVASNGAVKLSKMKDNTETNNITLGDESTTLGKPLAPGSGGTGVKSLDELKKVLGLSFPISPENGGTGVTSLDALKTALKLTDEHIKGIIGLDNITTLLNLRAAMGLNALDITSKLTYTTQQNFAKVTKQGSMVSLVYQSTSQLIDVNTVLFTIPDEYRPSTKNTTVPFVVDGTAFGRALIDNTTGECKVVRISAQATGVCAINISYVCASTTI